jgi:hypothetical protein
MGRVSDGQEEGEGHRWTEGQGQEQVQEQRRTGTDIDHLQKNKSLESVKFSKILQNRILSADALYKLKNKRSSVKLTFSK